MRRSYARRPTRGRRSRSRFGRRSGVKKRSRRVTNRVRPMSKKQILDLTSTKKHDTIVGLNLKQSSGEPVYTVSMGSGQNFMLWCPTARFRGGRGQNNPQVRSSDDVFWKGVSDNLHIETTTSDPWLWRRIVFTMATPFDLGDVDVTNYTTVALDADDVLPPTGQVPNNPASLEGIARYARTLEELPVAQYEVVTDRIFEGVREVDYHGFSNAKTDKTEIHVLSDKTKRIVSGNDSPVMKDYKHYIPLNKRMRYTSTESGSITQGNSQFAGDGTFGNMLHDVYILDYFEQLGTAPGYVNISANSKVYWHERS
uniref:Capsid protein n=1 Tax=Genomoviridae sp. TaxID=2202565 RepID=A0A858NM93_9VIRU|nr:MAG: capsid protein [Genomoviridae sp.]QJB18591.1 MAG: capsid protein [Genomoviridae sp.]